MQVTVYSTSNCAFCKVEKQWLDSKGIKYNSVNIEEDEDAKKMLEDKLGAASVPVTIIEGHEPIKGFNRPALTAALGI